MEERLQKILSRCGISSRRAAEELIGSGRVRVNGVPSTVGQKANIETDCIELDGVKLSLPERMVYIMLCKPCGYVTTMSDERGRPTVRDLTQGCGARVYPVGRLDLDSEGLLIMTNDGAAAHRLMHPASEVTKNYLTWVTGDIPAGIKRLSEPMLLDGIPLRPALVKKISGDASGAAQLSITIHEGKNRQIRRMCKEAGLHVSRLKRISEGQLLLGSLQSGHWRHLTEQEIAYVKSI